VPATDLVRSTQSIAQRLPDIPRWVEARSLLLSGHCEIFGLEDGEQPSLAARDPSTGSVIVIGRPDRSAVRAAVRGIMHDGTLMAAEDDAPWLAETLSGWTQTRAILHVLPDVSRLPAVNDAVRFLDPRTIDQLPIPSQLARELRIGADGSEIAAAFVDDEPVAFCYAGSTTESLWDVAIDTVPQHRRRGYAAACAAHMIRYMQRRGKRPVWGAVEENPASWRLALKLGFTPVDTVALFTPPA
jgi:GNAT superfamily N-acetyltransferase